MQLSGCSSNLESGDNAGWFAYSAKGPTPPPDLRLIDSFGGQLTEVDLTLSYDPVTNAFTGAIKNTTEAPLRQVGIHVHLSNGIQLDPTTLVDLAPGRVVELIIPAGSQPFTHWGADLEVT